MQGPIALICRLQLVHEVIYFDLMKALALIEFLDELRIRQLTMRQLIVDRAQASLYLCLKIFHYFKLKKTLQFQPPAL